MQLFKRMSLALVLVGLTGSSVYAEAKPETFLAIDAMSSKKVKELLQQGYPATKTFENDTALHYLLDLEGITVRPYTVTIGKLFLDSIKDKNELKTFLDVRNKLGETALYLAVKWYSEIKEEEYEEISKFYWWVKHHRLKPFAVMLLKYGADPNIQDTDKKSPLHLAAGASTVMTKLLLSSKRTNVNIKDKDGDTPLHIAAVRGRFIPMQTLLGDKRVKINAENKLGQTPFDIAVLAENDEVADLLKKRGGKTGSWAKVAAEKATKEKARIKKEKAKEEAEEAQKLRQIDEEKIRKSIEEEKRIRKEAEEKVRRAKEEKASMAAKAAEDITRKAAKARIASPYELGKGGAWRVELWNKPQSWVYVWVAGFHSNTPPRADDFQKILRGYRYIVPDEKDLVLYFLARDKKPSVGEMVTKLTFTEDKTVYIRQGEGGKFGPQTGPLKGWKGVTETGLSLKNNVTEKDLSTEQVTLKE